MPTRGASRPRSWSKPAQCCSPARDAYARYGKGAGNPAVLNFGDCLAYGVAAATNERLLYKGDDFAQTDIESRRE